MQGHWFRDGWNMVGTSPKVSVPGGEVADVISGIALWVWAVIGIPWSMAKCKFVVMKATGLCGFVSTASRPKTAGT